MDLQLQPTQEDDLDFVVTTEQSPGNRLFIIPWSREEHLRALTLEDFVHFVIKNEGRRVGYVILAGLVNPNKSIELRRIVITETNKGYGRETLRLVKCLTFEELGAHRLWLDVKEHNQRARHLYDSEDFSAEGLLRECVKTDSGFDSLVIMSILRSEHTRHRSGCTSA